MSEELVVPGTGEIVDLTNPYSCAKALADIRQHEGHWREIKAELTRRVAEECRRQGTKTLDIGDGSQAVLGGGAETQWDVEMLKTLLDYGLPQERYAELVKTTIEYRVDARVARQLSAANSTYAQIINDARSVYDRPQYVTIKRQR